MTDTDLTAMTPKQLATYMFNKYLQAEQAILSGAQSYSISGKTITRANLADIVKQRKYWENKLAILNGSSARKIKTVHTRH